MTEIIEKIDVLEETSKQTTSANNGQSMLEEGFKFLRGKGSQQDFGMAAARLLDAADTGLEEAYVFCALIYYCGVGVMRNTESAVEYASKYKEAQPHGDYAQVIDEILTGTIGTENAKNILLGKSNKVVSVVGKSKLPLIAAIALPVISLIVVGAYMFSGTDQSVDSNEINEISLDKILPPDEIAQAEKQAMSIAGALFSDAHIALEEKKKAEAERLKQQAEAEADERHRQKLFAEEQARTEAEAKQRAETESNARLAQQQLLQQQQQARQQQYNQQQQQQQARQQQYNQQQQQQQARQQQESSPIPGQSQQATDSGEPSSVGKALTGAAAAGAAFAIINSLMKNKR